MNDHDRQFYKERKSTPKHDSYIRNSKYIDDRDFTNIVDKVFSHQIAVFEDIDHEGTIDAIAISKEFIASYFYRNNYIPVEINSDILGAKIDSDEFSKRIVFEKQEQTRNNLFFLLGDVGSGKTAFINALLTKNGKKWVEENNIWFIRLDIDIDGNNRIYSTEQMLDSIIRKTVRVIQKNKLLCPINSSINQFKDIQKTTDKTFEEKQILFEKFVNAFQRDTKRKLFLIIDNIDYLYHLNDRIMFDIDDDSGEAEAMHSVCDLVSLFFHSTMGKLNANILFVLRTDSYEILKESKKVFPSVQCFDSNKNVYSIIPPDWEKVVYERGKLLEFVISKIDKLGKKELFKNITKPILRDLAYAPSGQKPLIEHLQNITNFGLRDMMVFFAQYSWLEGQSYKDSERGIERFIHQYPVGLLAFMLKGRRRYHQFNSEFPNIYLVNVKDRCPTIQQETYQHPHTYWLKRLILHYIKQKEDENEIVTTSNVLNIFRASSGDGYDDFLIRKCLGSLAQAKVSNMISAKRTKSVSGDTLEIEDIMLTHRGRHCLDHIIDRFFYLQLIVEDFMLPLPRLFSSQFDYPDEDYGYIIEPVSQYGKKAKRMVSKKAKQVLLLLEILESSFNLERLKYKSVFDRLQNENIPLPDISRIKVKVRDEIRAISSAQYNFINVSSLSNSINSEKEKIDEYLFDAYAG